MGKTGRKSKHETKMKKKKALKAQKRAAYAALAGTSRKNKKRVVKRLLSGILKHAHAMANCGNVGCEKCYPKIYRKEVSNA